ncbi:MAG: hypothetical protein Q8L27_04795, partial [archaeon]|nr:hypothetical protein [archaeon]
QSDIVNLSNGMYNITLPAPVETGNILIFVAATNTSAGVTTYYGGFRNVTLSYGTANYGANFTMYSLLGNLATITLNVFGQAPTNKNVTTTKQTFTITDGSGSPMASTAAHVEVTVDYSSLAAAGNNITTTAFTWMTDVAQSQAIANFSIPLLNSVGIKEMNVFVNGGPSEGNGQYAPKRKTFTVAEIQANSNITISTFNPGAIDSSVAASSISMALYLSNSTCDVPNPPAACLLGGSGQTMSSFNPMKSVMGGGKLSFRMGYGGILVHYVNVDMMASGPPDANFDSAATTSAGAGGFASAMRFGGQGPTIYDYVLISMPYTEGGVNGLKDNVPVSMSIPVLYDDSWNVIWNVSANGTNSANLAGNYSHYSTYPTAWGNLTTQTTCRTSAVVISSMMNETNPCYIDTMNNLIWIRLPHFSGTGPSVNGSSSTDIYTTSGAVTFLDPTPSDLTYLNQNQIIINVTTNLSDFQNLTIFIYNHSNNLVAVNLNYTYNSSNPTVYFNYSGIPDGMWSFNVSAVNSSGFRNSSILRNITLDTTLPFIINGSRTDNNGSYLNRNWIYFNVSIAEINPANISFYLYNSSLILINTTSYALMTNSSLNLANNTINWTGLGDGVYYYNASIIDQAGNSNATVMWMATVDAVASVITILSPVNQSTYFTNQTIVISFNSSDVSSVNLWFANATVNITYVDKNWTRFTSAGWYNYTFYANNSAAVLTTVMKTFRVLDQPANVAIANTSTFDANATGTNIIVPYNSSLQNLTINSTFNATAYTLNFSQILLSGNAVIGGLSNLTLVRVDAAGGTLNYTVLIQDNSNISGGTGWDGSLSAPIANLSTFISPTGTTSAIISVGSNTIELNLTKPAKITFIGLGGKSAAWARTGTYTLTDIATVCNSITAPTNIDATTTRECYVDSGSDLIIWTYHFTSFAAYTPTAAAVAATTTSSGGTASTTNTETLATGLTKSFSTGDTLSFKFDSKTYIFMLLYTKDGNKAYIQFSPNTQQVMMAVGEEKGFDINKDGKNDVSVKINSVTGIKADITLKLITDTPITPVVDTTPTETTLTEQITESVAEITGKWSPAKKVAVSVGILLALGVLIVGIIIGIQRFNSSRIRNRVKTIEFARN